MSESIMMEHFVQNGGTVMAIAGRNFALLASDSRTSGQGSILSNNQLKIFRLPNGTAVGITVSRMSMDVKGQAGSQQSKSLPNTSQGPQECAGCGKLITERFLLKALDMYWHEDCLKCGCCDCRLGEVGSTLYTKANLILCKRDYLRLFGSTGYCAACSKVIPAFEMVMRARNNVYHLECFACQQCNHRFCVGDRFYLCENKILCEYDYEERMVFANMAYNPNTIAQLKRHASHIPPAARSNGQMGGVPPPPMTNGAEHSMTSNGHHHFNNQTESNMLFDVK